MSLADAYRYAAEVMTENMMARDAEEGIGAFIEKRDADMAGLIVHIRHPASSRARTSSNGFRSETRTLRSLRNDDV